METKNVVIIVLAVVIVVLLGFLYFYPLQKTTVIGGDRDENGCLIVGGYSWNETEKECVREWETGEERYPEGNLDEYFREEMWRRGVENNGRMMPIEGFDPSLFMGAYSGLVEEDFDGVGAIGGRWEFENGKLEFVREVDDVFTSADGTVNEEGMRMLMGNIEERFGLEVDSTEDVDELIDVLSN